MSGAGSVILRTVDSGRTWERDSVGFPLEGVSVAVDGDGRALVSGAGVRDPYRAMMARSVDSGRIWEPVSFPYPMDVRNGLASDVALGKGGNGIVVMDLGIIYRTDDHWETFIPVTQVEFSIVGSPQWFRSLSFGSEQLGLVPNSHVGGYSRTTDKGITWLARQFGGGTVRAANFYSETGAYMVKDRPAAMVHTSDGGETWSGTGTETDAENFWVVSQMHFFDSLNGYQVGSTTLIQDQAKGFFYRTTDGAATLSGVTFDYPKYMRQSSFVSPSLGWIAGHSSATDQDSSAQGYEYGVVMRTTDGGDTWKTVYDHFGIYAAPLLLRFRNAEHGVICVGGDSYGRPEEVVLLETTDAGESWHVKAGFPLQQAPLDIVFLNDTLWYAVGGRLSIWETTDAGETWRLEEIDPLPERSASFSEIMLLPDERTVIISGRSMVVRRVFPEKVTGVREADVTNSLNGNIALSPNPAQNRLRVALEQEGAVKGTQAAKRFALYNTKGEEVLSADLDPLTKTALELDVSSLPSGNYRGALLTEAGEVLSSTGVVIER